MSEAASTNTSISKRYGTLWAEYHTVSSFRFRPVASFEHAQASTCQIARRIFPLGPRDDAAQSLSSRYGGPRTFPPRRLNSSTAIAAESENCAGSRITHPTSRVRWIERRLAYDEFIAERRSRLRWLHVGSGEERKVVGTRRSSCRPTTVKALKAASINIRTPYLTRPVIHVPLIIRTPGPAGRTHGCLHCRPDVARTHDSRARRPAQTGLDARAESLAKWLNRDGEGEGEGLAFTQYSGEK